MRCVCVGVSVLLLGCHPSVRNPTSSPPDSVRTGALIAAREPDLAATAISLNGEAGTGEQLPPPASRYLGAKPPSVEPEIFAPGVISKSEEHEFGSVFSTDGLELFYGVDLGGRAEIRTSRSDKGVWSAPVPLVSSESFSFNDPFLSIDEKRLYFISDQPRSDASVDPADYDIWFIERTTSGWSEPINAGEKINSEADEYYISFAADGTLYFASNRSSSTSESSSFDIYSARPANDGGFLEPTKLQGGVNTGAYEADAFVAPDESYLILSSTRRSGLGRGDLYVSFRAEDGSWLPAKALGDRINTSGHELCPFVTRDGRFLFYTSRQDIYWVDASIIEEVR